MSNLCHPRPSIQTVCKHGVTPADDPLDFQVFIREDTEEAALAQGTTDHSIAIANSGTTSRSLSYDLPERKSAPQTQQTVTLTTLVSLGFAVRYANAPYTVSKIISVVPQYMFYSYLSYDVVIRDAQTSKRGSAQAFKELKVSTVDIVCHSTR